MAPHMHACHTACIWFWMAKDVGMASDGNFSSYLICRSWYNHFLSFSMGGNVVFLDGDNFCKAFAGALVNMCPHPEKPFSNSKTISQIKFPYRIEKLVKSQQEWPGGKTLCRSLVTCKGFFCPVVLLLLLCENAKIPFWPGKQWSDLSYTVY